MIAILLFAATISTASAHSWVECVDYDPPSFNYQTLGNYDRGRCSGYPRAFKQQYSAGFGIDTGYNWEYPDCRRDPFKATDYNEEVRMATFQAGQTIYISHPAKNHVADICTNPFIPSTSMEVKMSSMSGVDLFDVSLEMVGAKHTSGKIDHLDYQNCFEFCSNQDKAHCVTGWILPTNITDGMYSFAWVWEFNPDQYYQNCFDAYITGGAAVIDESGSAGSATGSGTDGAVGSGSDADDSDGSADVGDITILPTTTVPAPTSKPKRTTKAKTAAPTTTVPAPTEDTTIEVPPAVVVAPNIDNVTTPEPTTATPKSDVISSGASSIVSPIQYITNYIVNITGYFNVTGRVAISLI